MPRVRARALVPFLLVGLALLCLPGSAAGAGSRQAKRAVDRVLVKAGMGSRSVKCKRSARRRFSCRWKAERKRSTGLERCKGRARARVRARRTKLRWSKPRCRTAQTAAIKVPQLLPKGPQRRTPPASQQPAPAPTPEPTPTPTPEPTPTPTPEPTPTPVPGGEFLFGFTDHSVEQGYATLEQSQSLQQRAGANSMRIGVDWRWLEPTKGHFNWKKYDDLYAAARAHGIRPVFMLLFAPSWALDGQCNQYVQDCTYPPTRAHLADWRTFVQAVVARYPEMGGLEIWNEPNVIWFWKPAPDVDLYVDMLREAYTGAKAINPAIPVAGASLPSNGTTTSEGMAYTDYLRQMYELGAKNYTDAISLHPYPNALDMSRITATFDAVRAIKSEFGDSAKRMWVTEIGYTTTGTGAIGQPFRATEAEQAWGLVNILRTLRAQPDVDVGLFHTLVEPKSVWYANPADPRDAMVGYGVLRQNLAPKPAYCALAAERGGAC